MKQPTKEQKQWFWEQCADEVEHFNEGRHRHYRFGSKWFEDEPPIDPNSLLKWAVPFLKDACEEWWDVIVEWAKDITGNYGKDTLALFWAIYKALGGKE